MGILMDKFKARSGREVVGAEDGSLMFAKAIGYLSKEAVFDAEEYFQHRQDERWGRWRSRLNPRYVVYAHGGYVLVLDEATGLAESYGPDVAALSGSVLREYREAHPEPRPWEDAQPGEVWVIRYRGEESAWVAGRGDFAHLFEQAGRSISRVHADITEGRRIWPVAS